MKTAKKADRACQADATPGHLRVVAGQVRAIVNSAASASFNEGVSAIRYRKGYCYQLVDVVPQVHTEGLRRHPAIRVLMPGAPDVFDDRSPFAYIDCEVLYVLPGYAWDGASGAIDTPSFMTGSAVHDAICQLTDLGLLLYGPWRRWGDLKLVEICRANGMSRLRAWWVLRGVRWFSKRNSARRRAEPVFTAPAEMPERQAAR